MRARVYKTLAVAFAMAGVLLFALLIRSRSVGEDVEWISTSLGAEVSWNQWTFSSGSMTVGVRHDCCEYIRTKELLPERDRLNVAYWLNSLPAPNLQYSRAFSAWPHSFRLCDSKWGFIYTCEAFPVDGFGGEYREVSRSTQIGFPIWAPALVLLLSATALRARVCRRSGFGLGFGLRTAAATKRGGVE